MSEDEKPADRLKRLRRECKARGIDTRGRLRLLWKSDRRCEIWGDHGKAGRPGPPDVFSITSVVASAEGSKAAADAAAKCAYFAWCLEQVPAS